jgi:uncharacterized membrane protein
VNELLAWLATLTTIAVLVAHEAVLTVAQRRRPERMARSAHATLREDWFTAVSQQKGSEILAVQTLRNSLMSATMTASTAMLGLIGTVTLAVPSLQKSLGDAAMLPHLSPRLVLELLLLAFLVASLVCSAMAVRYYNHAGFLSGMPVESESRMRWAEAGTAYVRRAGVMYSWGLRHLILVAPILACLLHPLAGPIAAVLVVLVLARCDRIAASGAPKTY